MLERALTRDSTGWSSGGDSAFQTQGLGFQSGRAAMDFYSKHLLMCSNDEGTYLEETL